MDGWLAERTDGRTYVPTQTQNSICKARKTDGESGQQQQLSMPFHSIFFYKKLMDSGVYQQTDRQLFIDFFVLFVHRAGQDRAGGTYTKRFFELDL